MRDRLAMQRLIDNDADLKIALYRKRWRHSSARAGSRVCLLSIRVRAILARAMI
jgi:hypothetical protein